MRILCSPLLLTPCQRTKSKSFTLDPSFEIGSVRYAAVMIKNSHLAEWPRDYWLTWDSTIGDSAALVFEGGFRFTQYVCCRHNTQIRRHCFRDPTSLSNSIQLQSLQFPSRSQNRKGAIFLHRGSHHEAFSFDLDRVAGMKRDCRILGANEVCSCLHFPQPHHPQKAKQRAFHLHQT